MDYRDKGRRPPAEKGQPPNPFENIFERARQEVFDASWAAGCT